MFWRSVLEMEEKAINVAFTMTTVELVADLDEYCITCGPFAFGIDNTSRLECSAEGVNITMDVAYGYDAVGCGIALGRCFLGVGGGCVGCEIVEKGGERVYIF